MYDLVLDPSRLPDINNPDEGLQEYLYDFPGESYRETINLNNYPKLDNKTSDVKLNHILKRDLWWDSDECMKYGLVDRIGF